MTTITSQNVKFNGTLENAAVLKSGVPQTLILTDDLSAADRALLDEFVAKYGSNPLAGPTAAVGRALFPAATVGGTATGLVATASPTAGVATINLGGLGVGGNPSGLSSSVGTAGSQTVNLAPGVVGASATGLFAGTAATSGSQSIAWTGLVGASATGLVGGTTYTATVTIDGVANPISILGSTATTFTDLITQVNADLTGAVASIVSPTELRITSSSTGATSTILIAAGTLFAAPLAGVGAIQSAVAGTAVVPATTYTVTMTVDGVSTPISILGSDAQTYTTLLAQMNTDLGVAATASLSGGDLKVTSASLGTASKVRMTSGNLFPALTAYQGVLPPADGDSTGRTYSATVVVDGVLKSVSFSGVAGTTLTNVITELNTDLGASATAAITGGNITITSATTGSASSVKVYDTGFLFSSLTNYAGITDAAGLSARVYTASITVDGVVKPVAVQGSAAQTFTTLLAELNTDLGASATASLSGGSILVTSATTGLTSTVSFADGDLFRSVAGFSGFATQAGAVDLVDEMKKAKVGSASLFDLFNVKVVGPKPAVPAVPAVLPKIPEFTYYTVTGWKYLADDTDVNP